MAFSIFIISGILVGVNLFNQKTVSTPTTGGKYVEGTVGQPIFINPVLVNSNSPDRDLIEIIFSNIPDLSEKYKISDDRKTWNIRLKENVFWHDEKPITSDDIIFTINTIQDPDSQSRLFSTWQNIKADRISEREFKLTLPQPYAFFESTLKELRPIPKHIFGNIPPANFKLSNYNLEPIGNGPFEFSKMEKRKDGFITNYKLEKNENYFGDKPYITEFNFNFYPEEKNLIEAFNMGEIDGFGSNNQSIFSKININHETFGVRSSRYYSIFFNPYRNPAFKEKNVRLALNYATPKKEILEKSFNNKGIIINGPILPEINGYAPEFYEESEFLTEKAVEILEANNWKINSSNVREKNIGSELIKLEFNIVVPDINFIVSTANIIKENWEKTGVKVNLSILNQNDINDIIKTREYEVIIMGTVLGNSTDLFSLWHSSEKFYPGLNLAMYENKSADSLMESIRKELNETKRYENIKKLQSTIIEDLPAIFLFSPNYFYFSRNSLNGFETKFIPLPENRFDNIEKWYIKTAKIFK